MTRHKHLRLASLVTAGQVEGNNTKQENQCKEEIEREDDVKEGRKKAEEWNWKERNEERNEGRRKTEKD